MDILWVKLSKFEKSVSCCSIGFANPTSTCSSGFLKSLYSAMVEPHSLHRYFPLSTEGSIRALNAMLTFTNWVKNPPGKITKFTVKKDKVKKILDNAKKEKRNALLEEEGQEILRAYGFPLPASKLAKTKKEAVTASKKIGYPVLMMS